MLMYDKLEPLVGISTWRTRLLLMSNLLAQKLSRDFGFYGFAAEKTVLHRP